MKDNKLKDSTLHNVTLYPQEHVKPQISIESFHKLNRASSLAHFVYLDLKSRPFGEMNQLYVPTLFCYLHEDISDILEELKKLGLCDKWLKQSSNNKN